MNIFKGIIVTIIALALIVLFALLILTIRTSITAKNYSGYWKEELIDSGEYTVVIMGDSTALGVGASNPKNSFASLVKEKIKLQKRSSVRIVNLSATNVTYEEIYNTQLPRLKDYDADAVIIVAGRANIDRKKFEETTVNTFFSELPSGISYVTEIPGNYDEGRNLIVKELNRQIKKIAEGNGIEVIPLYDVTTDKKYDLTYYDWDFIHPNDKGHEVWAELISERL